MAQMANVSDITIGDKSTREYVSSRGEINTFSISVTDKCTAQWIEIFKLLLGS